MRRSSPRKPRAWDDEAWASNSDDDEFVVHARTRRQPSAAWARATDEAPHTDRYHQLPHEPPAAASVAPPAPAVAAHAPRDDPMDVLVSSWAERHMSLADTADDACQLDALLEGTSLLSPDPLAALDAYRAVLHCTRAAPPPEPESDEDETHATASASAAAFDPLATSGDGIMMTLEAPAPRVRKPRAPPLSRQPSTRTLRRRHELVHCLESEEVDLPTLRTLAWAGVPDALRPIVWPMLLGYLPATAALRTASLARKRAEYAAAVERTLSPGAPMLDRAIWHQIAIDVPRTNPGIRLWQQETTQRALERILYVWSVRHPASGYVQGINDLATPFLEVFLSAYISTDPETYELAALPPRALQALEADTFWCLSKLLDGIQDNYIFAQPGIERQLRRMSEIVARIDGRRVYLRSAPACPPRQGRRGVHPVLVPLDQLPADARDEREEHHTHLGHVPRRGCGRLFGLPPVRLRGVPAKMADVAAGHGLPGYHHVPTEPSYTGVV